MLTGLSCWVLFLWVAIGVALLIGLLLTIPKGPKYDSSMSIPEEDYQPDDSCNLEIS